jgi:hypothetical protein
MQQSHSSPPQSHPKHGFDTVLIGFLTEPPEPEEGSVQLIGVKIVGAIVGQEVRRDRWDVLGAMG